MDIAYNIEDMPDSLIAKVADTLGLIMPVSMEPDKVRLLLRYFYEIKRVRGTEEGIKKAVRLLNSTEEDIALLNLEDYSKVTIEVLKDGFLVIRYKDLKHNEYYEDYLRRFVPAGYAFRVESDLTSDDKWLYEHSKAEENFLITNTFTVEDPMEPGMCIEHFFIESQGEDTILNYSDTCLPLLIGVDVVHPQTTISLTKQEPGVTPDEVLEKSYED